MLCSQGDLKRLLRSGSVPLTPVQRLSICYEASLALSHLASRHIVHTDVAARNFLVARSLTVKLASVAAARGVDAGDYCELAGRLVPLRWLAPESAVAASYTAASDVWAYAIFVTEVSGSLSSLAYTGQLSTMCDMVWVAPQIVMMCVYVCPVFFGRMPSARVLSCR